MLVEICSEEWRKSRARLVAELLRHASARWALYADVSWPFGSALAVGQACEENQLLIPTTDAKQVKQTMYDLPTLV